MTSSRNPKRDTGDQLGRDALAALQSRMKWYIADDRPGILYPGAPDHGPEGWVGGLQISIDFGWNTEKEEMAFKAWMVSCGDCGSHSFFGAKEFHSMQDAVNWVEEELLSVLEELATLFDREVV